MRYQEMTGTPGIASGRLAVLSTPLVADPGTSIDYGTGYDWAGLLVERVSGEGFDNYCRQRIFRPLAMASTCLTVPTGGPGAVPVLRRQADGTFSESGIGYPAEPEFVTGGGCYYSTSGDYLRLQLAVLNRGALAGARVLSEHGVAENTPKPLLLGPFDRVSVKRTGETPEVRTAVEDRVKRRVEEPGFAAQRAETALGKELSEKLDGAAHRRGARGGIERTVPGNVNLEDPAPPLELQAPLIRRKMHRSFVDSPILKDRISRNPVLSV
jgi:hypothetical protein